MVTRRLGLVSLSVAVAHGPTALRAASWLGAHRPSSGRAGKSARSRCGRLRSPLPGTARVPSRLLSGASPPIRRAAGRILYRSCDVVHRMDLRLPPRHPPKCSPSTTSCPWRFADEGQPPAGCRRPVRGEPRWSICPSQFSADEVAVRVRRRPTRWRSTTESTGAFFDAVPLAEAELAALGHPPAFRAACGRVYRSQEPAGLADAWARVRSARADLTLALCGPPAPVARASSSARSRDRARRAGARRDTPGGDGGRVGCRGALHLRGLRPAGPRGHGRRSPGRCRPTELAPEVCGDAAYLVEPDGASLAEGLLAALEDGPATRDLIERGRLRASGFTWEASAAAHARLWTSYAA